MRLYRQGLSTCEIAQRLGVTKRNVRYLRAAANGYYLPANEEEKARFVRSMRHRAQEILSAADAVEKTN